MSIDREQRITGRAHALARRLSVAGISPRERELAADRLEAIRTPLLRRVIVAALAR